MTTDNVNPDWKTSDWNAWYNVMPGGPASLHVSGKIDFGNENDGASLDFDSLEKTEPPNLVLRIVEAMIQIPRQPGDHVADLKYTEPADPGKYGAVKILLGDEIVKEFLADDIQIVH